MTLRDEIREQIRQYFISNDIDVGMKDSKTVIHWLTVGILAIINSRLEEIRGHIQDRSTGFNEHDNLKVKISLEDFNAAVDLCTIDEPEQVKLASADDKLQVIKCRIQSWFDEETHSKSTIALLNEVINIITEPLEKVPEPEQDEEMELDKAILNIMTDAVNCDWSGFDERESKSVEYADRIMQLVKEARDERS